MREIMIVVGIAAILFITAISSAIAHESDIYRQCLEQGNSGLAGWTIKIQCSPIK